MRKLRFVLICFLLLVGAGSGYAQFNRKGIKKTNKRMASYHGGKTGFGRQNTYNSIGFSVNALNYYGDLSPSPGRLSTDISFTKPGFAISYTKRLGTRYSIQGQFMFGTLKGSDAESANKADANSGFFRYNRNLSFRNQIKELSVVGMVDLFENKGTYMSRVKWTPYVYAGLALFLHNPQAIAPAKDLKGNPLPEAGQWVDLRPLGTEGQYSALSPTDANYGIKPYSLLQMAIPFGLGARFRLTEVLDLSVDFGFRYTFTDYLDDVSENYVAPEKLGSPLAQAMAYRTSELPGNPTHPVLTQSGIVVEAGYGDEYPTNKRGTKNQNDIYMVTRIQIAYIISPSFHRAKFR